MNIERIRARMVDLGLTEELLAQHCGVDPQDVHGWLARRQVPRPSRLLKLCMALDLTYEELMGDASASSAPDVIFHGMTEFSESAVELAQDCGILLSMFEKQCPYRPQAVEASADASVEDLATAVAFTARTRLALNGTKPLQLHDLARLLADRGIVLVPTPSKGGSVRGFPPAFTVRCQGDTARFVVCNVASPPADAVRALVDAYAWTFAGPSLAGDRLARFSRMLTRLLVPLADVKFPNVLQLLCGNDPTPECFVERSEVVFSTPIFKLVGAWQDKEGARNHTFIARVFCMVLQDAVGVSGAIWNRDHPGNRVGT